MKIILLSGGSGKRLWPLSNEVRSKQFLKIVKRENGETESMVQRVYRQIKSADVDAEIAIATGETQVEAIKNQLGDKVRIVIEPKRRNTFPAIMLSAAYLYFDRKCPADETVVILPVDPYVDDKYFQALKSLDSAVQNHTADLVLLGVKPTYPSEKYGYIIPENGNAVREFKEKPDLETAKDLIAQGGLWNCGVVSAKLSYLIEILRSKIKCNSYAEILEKYSDLEKNSFDYVVLEKSKSIAVVSYDGEWKDLGTWNTLTEVMDDMPIGDVKISDDCVNTHVVNELEIPVVVMGAKDMVVAASPDGILVADKFQSSFIKKYVEDRDMRPMFEERSWGDYTVLNVSVDERGNKAVTKKKCIRAGNVIEETAHKTHSEVWTILSGKAVININGRNHDALPGDTYTIPQNTLHSLTAVENTVLMEVQLTEG
ncbi:MAG: cupin domain-containing protein [Oscillospiraceae bacterium]|nr:cupin domain-containing protein [Oscillospiraceae bacterium]